MDRTKIFAGLIAISLSFSCSRSRPLTIGTKGFTEQVILGEIVAQQIERRLHQKVSRLTLGSALVAHQALLKGDIDMYPEYSGTALTAVLKRPPAADPDAVLPLIREEYRNRWHLEWLQPFGFNNTFAMIVRGEDARNEHIETLSDAAKRASGWSLGAGYEFLERSDGLRGLLKTYQLPMKQTPKIMDLGLLYKALEQRQVDMVAGNATDGMLSVLDLKVLRDDKKFFPPYHAALVVRAESLAAHPGLREAAEQLSGKISNATMQELNYQVDGKHRPAQDVAAEFLRRPLI